MNRKLIVTIGWALLIALIAGIIFHLYWRNITLAQGHELYQKQQYLESLRNQSEDFSGLIAEIKDECEKNVAYYTEQKLYVDATIEEKENEIANNLGLKLQR